MEIELYDGTVLEFPDDTDPAVIQKVVMTETAARRGVAPEELAAQQPSRILGGLKAAGASLGRETLGKFTGPLAEAYRFAPDSVRQAGSEMLGQPIKPAQWKELPAVAMGIAGSFGPMGGGLAPTLFGSEAAQMGAEYTRDAEQEVQRRVQSPLAKKAVGVGYQGLRSAAMGQAGNFEDASDTTLELANNDPAFQAALYAGNVAGNFVDVLPGMAKPAGQGPHAPPSHFGYKPGAIERGFGRAKDTLMSPPQITKPITGLPATKRTPEMSQAIAKAGKAEARSKFPSRNQRLHMRAEAMTRREFEPGGESPSTLRFLDILDRAGLFDREGARAERQVELARDITRRIEEGADIPDPIEEFYLNDREAREGEELDALVNNVVEPGTPDQITVTPEGPDGPTAAHIADALDAAEPGDIDQWANGFSDHELDLMLSRNRLIDENGQLQQELMPDERAAFERLRARRRGQNLPPPPDQPPPPDGGPSHEYADVPLEERVRQAQPYFEHDGFGKQDIDEIFGPDVWPELIRRNNDNNQNEMRASGRAAIDAAWQRVREVRDKNQDWGYPIRTAEVRKAVEAAQQVSKEARDAERGALSLVEPDANTGALSLSSESGRLSQTEYKPRTMDRLHPNDPVGPRRAQPGKALSRDPWRVEPKEDTGTGRLGDPYLSERVNDEGKRVRERAGIRPEELDIGVGPDAQVWPGAERGRTPEEVRALTDSFGEPQRSPSPENVRQGRKDSGQPISDDEFFKKVTGEYGAFPGAQGAKDLFDRGVGLAKKAGGKVRDAFRTTDKDINPITAGFNPRGPNRPTKRVGFPGRGFGAPTYGPRGTNKQLGGGLIAHDKGQATNVVSRAMEHVTNVGQRVGQKLEQNTRKLPGRRQFERNFKTPSRIVKYLGDYRGHNARARRLLRRGRLAIRHMQRKGGLTPEMQRQWVERRERGEANPADHLPGPIRTYFEELGRQIDRESATFVRNARRIANRARARGDIAMANHFQAISDTAEQRIGQYLHRAYSRKPPSENLKTEVRALLSDNYFVQDAANPNAVIMLRGDEMGPQPQPLQYQNMTPQQRASADAQMDRWMEQALERKEDIQTPQMGEGGIGSPKVMRHRVLHDEVYRLFRGADKAALVGENSLALIRAQNAQLELFAKLSDHWKALGRLSPDEMRKLPEATWLGELSGQAAPRWLADLIHDNFSADAFGPADFKTFGKLMKFWKSKATIGNVSSHRNQGIQNFVNMFMAGVNPFDPRTLNAARLAHRDLMGHGTDRGPIFARLEEAGVLEAFQEAEYKQELRRDLDRVWEASGGNWEALVNWTRDKLDNGTVTVSDAYSYWDRLAKMTTYIRATGVDGGTGLRGADHLPERVMSHEEAVSFINDFYVNFSNVPKVVSVVRNQPALQLFVTPFFAAKALSAPIYSRALARKPFTLMMFMAFASGMKTLAWQLQGETDEQINTDLALQTKGEKRKAKMAVPSLAGDELETLDVTGGLPNYELLQAFGSSGDDGFAGDLMEGLIGATGDSILSGPIPSTVYGPYARKLHAEEDLAEQYTKEIITQLFFPGGPAQYNKLEEIFRAVRDIDKPGTAPDNALSSDTPGERLARRGLALPGLAGKPLDARMKMNAIWENERTRKELEKRFPAIFNKLYEKRITDEEAKEQVLRLLNKQFEEMMSIVPKQQTYKRPWMKPTQPDAAKSHGKVSLE